MFGDFYYLFYNFLESRFHGHTPFQTRIWICNSDAHRIKNIAALLSIRLTNLCDRAMQSQIGQGIWHKHH